jgi:hypothetical protein
MYDLNRRRDYVREIHDYGHTRGIIDALSI